VLFICMIGRQYCCLTFLQWRKNIKSLVMNERLPFVAISWFLPLVGEVFLLLRATKLPNQQIIGIFTNVV